MHATHTPEEWRPILGYEGLYEVSNYGRVRSLDRWVNGRAGARCWRRGKLLSPTSSPRNYQLLTLWLSGKGSHQRVHVLVLEACVGPRPNGLVACHNDGNGANNQLSNLRWDTTSSNGHDRVTHGNHYQANKTHCVNGHEFTPENTYHKPPHRDAKHVAPNWTRECRTCRKAARSKAA